MGVPSIYVWTHDSIGLGEDGPTHQPVEQLASLRAIPGLDVVRPADANEVCLRLEEDPGNHLQPGRHHPLPPEHAGLRRGDGAAAAFGSADGRRKGRLRAGRRRRATARSSPRRCCCIGTGSEVSAGRRGPRGAAGPGRRRPRGLHARAWSGSTSRTPPTANPCCPPPSRPASRSRPAWPRAGANWSATPAASSPLTTTAPPPTTSACSPSSASPPRPSPPPRTRFHLGRQANHPPPQPAPEGFITS